VKQLRESTLGLRLNGRMVLSMIREIRRHRAEAQATWVGRQVMAGRRVYQGKPAKPAVRKKAS
jgi:hypothetical protein